MSSMLNRLSGKILDFQAALRERREREQIPLAKPQDLVLASAVLPITTWQPDTCGCMLHFAVRGDEILPVRSIPLYKRLIDEAATRAQQERLNAAKLKIHTYMAQREGISVHDLRAAAASRDILLPGDDTVLPPVVALVPTAGISYKTRVCPFHTKALFGRIEDHYWEVRRENNGKNYALAWAEKVLGRFMPGDKWQMNQFRQMSLILPDDVPQSLVLSIQTEAEGFFGSVESGDVTLLMQDDLVRRILNAPKIMVERALVELAREERAA